MRIFIRAVNRPMTNVYSTLASLSTRDPAGFAQLKGVHIISGDGDRSFLRGLDRTEGLRLHFASAETYETIKQWQPKRRGAWSYSFALMAAREAGSDAVLMEDDVEVANGWYDRLRVAIGSANLVASGQRYAISGYYGFPMCPFQGEPRGLYEAKRPFWGNLFTFWPARMLSEVQPDFTQIVKNCVDMSTDLTVQDWLAGHDARLFYIHPGIAQHRGDATTLRPDGIRRSPNYSDGFVP